MLNRPKWIVSSGAVFRDDPASHTLWSTIEQPSLRDRIKEILQGMHEEAMAAQGEMASLIRELDDLQSVLFQVGE